MGQKIESNSNKKIKELAALQRSKKERCSAGLFVLEGDRIIRDAVSSRRELVEAVFVSETYAGQKGLPVDDAFIVSDSVLSHVCETVTDQGILATVRQEPLLRKEEELGDKDNILILEDIQDPGNLGTIIRTAEAAGVDAVIMSSGTVDIFSPKVVRSTMGSILRVPFTYAENMEETIGRLKNNGHEVYAAHLKGASDMRKTPFSPRRAIIIGNEGRGISEPVAMLADKRVFIPMHGEVESLNAAIAAAILMYHE
ncbi:MAG: RNA methyltransferase [Lachnospiraceae bacterium]|nr:RNA methyltransferase [Lachnospiraceae bacterium]